jgi:hypothetical protein
LFSARRLLIAFVPLLILVILLGFYLSAAVSSSSGAMITTTRISGSGSTVLTFDQKLSLNFSLSVNATAVPGNEAINIVLTATNTKETENELNASNSWAIKSLSTPCDYGKNYSSSTPVGIAFFKGDYGLNNISSATAISVWGASECLADFAGNATSVLGPWLMISNYSISPESDNGVVSGFYRSYKTQNVAQGTFPTELNFETNVYATNSTFGYRYNSLLSSSAGIYTIAAGDEWGQLVLLHFVVTPSTIQQPPGIVDIGSD